MLSFLIFVAGLILGAGTLAAISGHRASVWGQKPESRSIEAASISVTARFDSLVGREIDRAKALDRDLFVIVLDPGSAGGVALAHAQELGSGRWVIWHWGMLPPRPTPESVRLASRDPRLATIAALAEALDLRDADTSQHSRMVGWYSELIALELGMSPAAAERMRTAGLLHDIGKIGVPDSVLRKPAKLTDQEFAAMKEHPEIGARVLAPLDAEDVRSWVLSHHERVDGRGYPNGLTGDEIPLEARILNVADSYEAMTADRVYRAAPGPEFARGELVKCAGEQFDERVVQAFLAVLDRVAPLSDNVVEISTPRISPGDDVEQAA